MSIEGSYDPNRKPLQINDDPANGFVEIEGVRYSHELLKAWGQGGFPVGVSFRIVARDKTTLSIETVDPVIPPALP